MEEAVTLLKNTWRGQGKLKEYADSQLAEMKKDLGPLTKHLPEPVNHFLDRGGWWAVLGVIGLLAMLWLRSLVRKMTRPQKRSKKKKRKAVRKDIAALA